MRRIAVVGGCIIGVMLGTGFSAASALAVAASVGIAAAAMAVIYLGRLPGALKSAASDAAMTLGTRAQVEEEAA